MTVIIGAELSDGRRILMGDGRQTSNDRLIRDNAVKVNTVEVSMKKRKAIYGYAGPAAWRVVVRDALVAYMSTATMQLEDLYYRFAAKKDTFDEGFSVLAWLPADDGPHHLVEIDGKFYAREHDKFATIGSGGVEAISALNALAKRDMHEELKNIGGGIASPVLVRHWSPSLLDVQIAMDVAITGDVTCGGLTTILTL